MQKENNCKNYFELKTFIFLLVCLFIKITLKDFETTDILGLATSVNFDSKF